MLLINLVIDKKNKFSFTPWSDLTALLTPVVTTGAYYLQSWEQTGMANVVSFLLRSGAVNN